MAVARPMPAPAVALHKQKPSPAQHLQATSLPRFRRCTFRRLEATGVVRGLPMYDVECLHPQNEAPLPIGNLAAAHPVCAGCTLPGIFRPDAD